MYTWYVLLIYMPLCKISFFHIFKCMYPHCLHLHISIRFSSVHWTKKLVLFCSLCYEDGLFLCRKFCNACELYIHIRQTGNRQSQGNVLKLNVMIGLELGILEAFLATTTMWWCDARCDDDNWVCVWVCTVHLQETKTAQKIIYCCVCRV